MNSGYFSKEAVQDILAIKQGTIDFLKTENQNLKDRVDFLQQRVETLETLANSPTEQLVL